MKLLTKTLPIIGILVLAGCAELNQSVKNVQTPTVPSTSQETLPQICQAAKENRVKANDFYVNKGLSATGVVRSINEGFQPHYRVYMNADKINVHAGTENSSSVKQLTVGKMATVVGTITSVSYDYQGCSVALKDATF
jgi:hypothetical protein